MNTPYICEGDGNNKGKKRPLEATENVNINGRDLVNIYDRRRCRHLYIHSTGKGNNRIFISFC